MVHGEFYFLNLMFSPLWRDVRILRDKIDCFFNHRYLVYAWRVLGII